MSKVKVLLPLKNNVTVQDVKLSTTAQGSMTEVTISLTLDTTRAILGHQYSEAEKQSLRTVMVKDPASNVFMPQGGTFVIPTIESNSDKTRLQVKFAIDSKVPGGTGFVETLEDLQ